MPCHYAGVRTLPKLPLRVPLTNPTTTGNESYKLLSKYPRPIRLHNPESDFCLEQRSSPPHQTTMANITDDDKNQPHAFNPAGVAPPPPTYSHVAVTPLLPTSRFIALAGQIGAGSLPGGTLPPTVKLQAPLAYANIKTCLAAAGATPRDIVHVRHYIVKETGSPAIDRFDVVDRGWGEAWQAFMDCEAGGFRPPDTVVGVASLAKRAILYECEVTAIVH